MSVAGTEPRGSKSRTKAEGYNLLTRREMKSITSTIESLQKRLQWERSEGERRELKNKIGNLYRELHRHKETRKKDCITAK